MSRDTTLAVILTAHQEGLIAVPTLKSLERAVRVASAAGVSVEVLISLDKSDALTRDVFTSWRYPNSKVFDFDFGDPARCRNQCVLEARAEYIAILDADDLIGTNWIAEAVYSARLDPRQIVWHPEVNIVFGEECHLFCHLDMEDPEFDLLQMIAFNPWTSLCLARLDAFLSVPYPVCDFRNGIGHEDWGWNRRIVEVGYLHKVVKGTGHAIRRKANSVVKQASAANAIPAKTALFRNQLDKRIEAGQGRKILRAHTNIKSG